MKTFLTAAAVATIGLLGQWAQAQPPVYPPANYFPQQLAYAPPAAGMLPPGYAALPPGVNPAAWQQPAMMPTDPGALLGGGDAGQCGPACELMDCGPCDIMWELYGDFLYLRPRDAEVAFAVPANSVVPPPASPIQVGPVGVIDPHEEPGFRVGGRHYFDPRGSVGAEYWWYESGTNAFAAADVTNVLQGTLLHPLTATAAQPWQEARARLDIDFQRINLDYRFIYSCSARHEVALVGGAAYGGLHQDFDVTYSILGSDTVGTSIDFDGGGIRVGLEAERHGACTGFFVYGKGYATFLAGDFHARYLQTQAFDPLVVDTSWEAGRVVPVLDLEVGVGWAGIGGSTRMSAGYMVSSWFNTVKTDDWVQAVQTNTFTGLSDTMTFDGLVVRGEIRF